MVPRILVPPRLPISRPMAVARRFSEENWSSTPWAARGSGAPRARSTAATLVEPRNLGSGEVGGQDRLIVLAGVRAAQRAPLAEAHAVSRAQTLGDHARDAAAVAGHGELEGLARE